MEELTHILNDKFIKLDREIAFHDLPYTDDFKNKILYKIGGIVHDACMARGYTYDVLKYDENTVLFEVKNMLYGLIVTVLFRHHDVKIFLNCY